MPISADLRKFYGKTWETETRPRILARAGYKCEQCGKPDRTTVWTVTAESRLGLMYWKTEAAQVWRDQQGLFTPRMFFPLGSIRKVRVVLTVAHLNHTPGDDRAENLKALCGWCHLNYDKLHHKETRQARKDRARPLLAEQEPCP